MKKLYKYHKYGEYDKHDLVKAAKKYMNLHDFEKAKDFLETYVKQDSSNKYVYQSLGYCYKELGKIDLAISVLKEGLKQDQHHFQSLKTIAFCYLKKHRLKDALRYFIECNHINPYDKACTDMISHLKERLKKSKIKVIFSKKTKDSYIMHCPAKFKIFNLIKSSKKGFSQIDLRKITKKEESVIRKDLRWLIKNGYINKITDPDYASSSRFRYVVTD